MMNVTCLGNKGNKHSKNNNHKDLPPLHNLETNNTLNKHTSITLKISIQKYVCMLNMQ